MRTPMTASAATIQILKHLALYYISYDMRKIYVEHLQQIATLRKRYDKKWQHQL